MRPDLCLTKKHFYLRISALWNLWKDYFQVFLVIPQELFLSPLCPLTWPSDYSFLFYSVLLFPFLCLSFLSSLVSSRVFQGLSFSFRFFLGMTEFYHYCQSCDRNSIHWLMFDINFHQLLAADEVIGNVVICGSWTCIWLLLLFKLCLSFILLSFWSLADWLLL
jgi:hypothetical protein